jgi:PAS domain S-box-containing protein
MRSGADVENGWAVEELSPTPFGARGDAGDLQEHDGPFRALLQQSSDLTLVLSEEDLVVVYASPASVRVLGVEPSGLVGTQLTDFIHPEDLARAFASSTIGRDGTGTIECRWRHADGTWRDIESVYTDLRDDRHIQGFVINARDVTTRNQLQRELRRSQKLESVGQLASGIAHEINTPVQFVGDNFRFFEHAFETAFALIDAYRAALAPDRPPLSWTERCAFVDTAERMADVDYLRTEVPRAIKEARDGVDRIATIVRAMRSFGHPDGAEQCPADINDCLADTLAVARNELKYVATVETDFGDLPAVSCYRGDVNQVFLNLLINAAHAIADARTGSELGTITVRTRRDRDDVVISVGDTGVGIPNDVRDRVFDPFFTTKEVGKGTGHGLALARSVVVDRHGGALTYDSVVGAGTTFHVRLPIGGVRNPLAAGAGRPSR